MAGANKVRASISTSEASNAMAGATGPGQGTSKTPRSNRGQNQEGSHRSGIAGVLMGVWNNVTSSPAGKSTKGDEVRSVRVSSTTNNTNGNSNSKTPHAGGVGCGVEMSGAGASGSDVEAREGPNPAEGDARLVDLSANVLESSQDDDGLGKDGTGTHTVSGENKDRVSYSRESSDKIDGAICSHAQNKVFVTGDEEQGLGATQKE